MSVDKKKISVWKVVGLMEQLVRWCSNWCNGAAKKKGGE